MTLEIIYDLIFGKWCFVSVFESRTVSNVDATDPMRNKKVRFSQNFGMVNFEKIEHFVAPFCIIKQSYTCLWLMCKCALLKCKNGVRIDVSDFRNNIRFNFREMVLRIRL